MRFSRILFLWLFAFFGRSHALLNVSDVLALKDANGIITVTDENYGQLSQGIYEHFIVLFITTSVPNNKGELCSICDDFESVQRQVSVIISEQAPHAQVLFLKADAAYNIAMTRDLKLTTIPHLLIFPPPETENFHWSNSAFYQYELKKDNVTDALQFADFLAKILKIFLNVNQGFQYQEFFSYFIACIIIFSIMKRVVLPKIPNKPKVFSMLFSLGIILLSITGFKFTQINSIPFIARDPKGNIMYFSGGTGWQFGIEILSVSTMYIAMGLLFCIIIYIPNFSLNPQLRWIVSATSACALFYLFSYYVSCFDIKNPGYPFKF